MIKIAHLCTEDSLIKSLNLHQSGDKLFISCQKKDEPRIITFPPSKADPALETKFDELLASSALVGDTFQEINKHLKIMDNVIIDIYDDKTSTDSHHHIQFNHCTNLLENEIPIIKILDDLSWELTVLYLFHYYFIYIFLIYIFVYKYIYI